MSLEFAVVYWILTVRDFVRDWWPMMLCLVVGAIIGLMFGTWLGLTLKEAW